MSEKQFIKAKHVLMFLFLILLMHLLLYMMGEEKFKINKKHRPVLLQTFSESKVSLIIIISTLLLELGEVDNKNALRTIMLY